MDVDKCKWLITNNDDNISLVDGQKITAKTCVKLLGRKSDNKLDFNDHVSKFIKKQVLNYMLWQELRIL